MAAGGLRVVSAKTGEPLSGEEKGSRILAAAVWHLYLVLSSAGERAEGAKAAGGPRVVPTSNTEPLAKEGGGGRH